MNHVAVVDVKTGAMVMQPAPPPGITVNAAISDGTKKVALVIHDAATVASLVLQATGHSEFTAGVQALAGLAETALDGYENGASVVITPESITGLLADPAPLAPAIDGSTEKTIAVPAPAYRLAYDATEDDVKFLQSSGYKVETVEQAHGFISALEADEQLPGYVAAIAKWKEAETRTTERTAEVAETTSKQAENAE